MSRKKFPIIHYWDTSTIVQPGDRVKMKRWFRWVDGTVAHVPGISATRKEFDDYDVLEVAVKTVDGMLYGVVVDPDSDQLRKIVQFQGRGPDNVEIPKVIDDPYIENE